MIDLKKLLMYLTFLVAGLLILDVYFFVRLKTLESDFSNYPGFVVADWNSINSLNNDKYSNNDALQQQDINQLKILVEKFKANGYIVLDGRYINAAPDNLILNSDSVSQSQQQDTQND